MDQSFDTYMHKQCYHKIIWSEFIISEVNVCPSLQEYFKTTCK